MPDDSSPLHTVGLSKDIRLGMPDRWALWRTVGLSLPWLGLIAGAVLLPANVQPRMLARSARGLTAALQIKLDVQGLEHVQPNTPYVIVSLHEGFADALALFHLPLPLRFVARNELFTWPKLGRVLRATQHVMVNPERGASGLRSMLRDAAPVFARGESLVVFAQGTILGLETAFRLGAFAVAQRYRVPILPVAITGSHRVWEHPFSPRLRLGERISMRVLEPIRLEASDDLETVRLNVQRTLKRVALEPGLARARRYDPHRDGFWDGYSFEIDPDFAALEAVIRAHRAGGTPRVD